MTDKRKIWIDLVRGFCMLAILVHHTEMYYVGEAIIDYRFFVDNALCTFFFISGYLFYKETPFNLKYKLLSILKTIIIPYFIFMSVIALPKALAHGKFVSVSDSILSIVLGQQSWFITALATAEIIFSILLYLSKQYKWVLPIGVLISFIGIILLTGNEQMLAHNYWNIMDGLLAISFLYIGYLYHQKENVINRFPLYLYIIPFILFFISKWVIVEYKVYCYLGPVDIDNYPVFIVDNVLAILLITRLCKLLPDMKPISWMGSHVIVYYFLCGGVPLTLSVLANKIGFSYYGNYLQVIVVLIAVYLMITLLTWFIYKYIPWATGRFNR
jgi:fucose 4-O-acetylase-like acetyltransferase